MGLSNDLISQFVEVTNTDEKPKNKTSTVYGTVMQVGDQTYVQFDGSKAMTPVSSTVKVNVNDRVVVTIKNHTATITGNLKDPSASSKDVDGAVSTANDASDKVDQKIAEFEIAIGERVTVDQLNAEKANIMGEVVAKDAVVRNELTASMVEVEKKLTAKDAEITGKLEADEAEITNLKANKLDAEFARNTYATIVNLTSTNTEVNNLKVTHSEFVNATVENFESVNADIEKLDAKIVDADTIDATYAKIEDLNATNAEIETLDAEKLDVAAANATYAKIVDLNATNANVDNLNTKKLDAATAKVTYAKIEDLNATNANVDNLESDIGDINTLIFGSATGSTIQASFANAIIAQLSDAMIKSAMIDTISADKITALNLLAGTIKSDKVTITSEDGKLTISDETIQISDGVRVRVQIGKDASDDYSINIYDEDGNLMFSKGGITDKAIKNAIIRNDMVSDDANISAHKLDIDSLFEEINGSSKTIKSSKVKLDETGQTLDVAFTELTTDVDELNRTVESQGTDISVMQGQISSKVWKQDITKAVNDIEIGGRNYFVRKNINNLAWGSGNTILENPSYRGFSFPVSEGEKWTLYRTDTTNNRWGVYWLDTEPAAGVLTVSNPMRNDSQAAYHVNHFTVPAGITWGFIYLANDGSDIPNIMLEKANKASDWSPAPEDVDGEISELSTRYSAITQTVDNISATVASHTSELANKANSSAVEEVSDKVAEIELNISGFRTEVGNTYAKKSDVESSASTLRSSINQNAQSIGTLVSRTSAVENKFDNYSTTEEVQSAINQKADSITSSVNSKFNNYSTTEEVQSAINQKADSITASVNSKFDNYSTTEEVNSAINQKADSITSSVSSKYATIKSVNDISSDIEGLESELNGLEIGGRNYFSSSKTVDLGCTGLSSGEQSLISTGSCISFYVPVEEGQVWSLSRASTSNNRFDYCFTVDEPASGVLIYGWNSGARELLKIEGIVVPAGSGYKYLFIYLSNQNDELDNVKLERGNRATDWTPAPEDMATAEEVSKVQSTASEADSKASTAQTLISQLTDSISTLVTDGNGTSLMTQTEDGWTFSTATIQDLVNKVSDNLNTLTEDVGGVSGTVELVKQAVEDLGTIAEYVNITTYKNEPCIELGESDSDFKLRITNTQMMFTEGSTVLAYFTNQAFNSKKVVIEEELQQGGFAWKVRSNGNLGLIWKGGNS